MKISTLHTEPWLFRYGKRDADRVYDHHALQGRKGAFFPEPRVLGECMRGYAFFFLIILLACLLVLPVMAIPQVVRQEVMVTNYKVNPPVLSPEGYGVITIDIEQTGKTGVKESWGTSASGTYSWDWYDNTYIDHIDLEGNGLELVSPEYDRVGNIGPGKVLHATFIVRAPRTSGIYFPEVWMDTDAGPIRFPIPVNVNSPIGIHKEAFLILQNADPGTVYLGDDIPVRLRIRNAGGTLADDVMLKIGGNSSTVLAPKQISDYYLGTLNPDQEKTLDVTFLSDINAKPGIAKVPVAIQYTTGIGTAVKQSTYIDLVLEGAPELGISAAETRPGNVTGSQPFDLVLTIENTGTGPARDVHATIDLPIGGIRELDVGKIAAGGEGTAVFLMEGGRPGIYTCNATISYAGDSGILSDTHQISLRINNDNYTPLLVLGIILIIIVAVAAVLHLRRWKRTDRAG